MTTVTQMMTYNEVNNFIKIPVNAFVTVVKNSFCDLTGTPVVGCCIAFKTDSILIELRNIYFDFFYWLSSRKSKFKPFMSR